VLDGVWEAVGDSVRDRDADADRETLPDAEGVLDAVSDDVHVTEGLNWMREEVAVCVME
jgi:hypothetical protein